VVAVPFANVIVAISSGWKPWVRSLLPGEPALAEMGPGRGIGVKLRVDAGRRTKRTENSLLAVVVYCAGMVFLEAWLANRGTYSERAIDLALGGVSVICAAMALSIRALVRSWRAECDLTVWHGHGIERWDLVKTGTAQQFLVTRVKDSNVITIRPATPLDRIAAFTRDVVPKLRRQWRSIRENND
jgi:hypothetical protein